MNSVRVAGFLVLLLTAGWASSAVPENRSRVGEEFVGTTPCDVRMREFLSGVASNAACHCVTWQITFYTNSTYQLIAAYGLPGRKDPNQVESGPTVKLDGQCEIIRGFSANPRAVVYRIRGLGGRVLNLVRLGEHLLHFADSDGRLLIGNAGWSYTLNRKGIGHED